MNGHFQTVEREKDAQPAETLSARLLILQSAAPNSWVALSHDESRLVGAGQTFSEAADAADAAGEPDPVIIKIPGRWTARVR